MSALIKKINARHSLKVSKCAH